MAGSDRPLVRAEDGFTDLWFRGWRLRFPHGATTPPEIVAEDAPSDAVPAAGELQVAVRNNGRVDIRRGEWIVRFELDPATTPSLRSALPEAGGGFGRVRGG
jgi:hypothetical protein